MNRARPMAARLNIYAKEKQTKCKQDTNTQPRNNIKVPITLTQLY